MRVARTNPVLSVPSSHRLVTVAAIVVWSLALVGVTWWITDYEFSTYGTDHTEVVAQWPSDSAIVASHERSTLLLFIHPHCPCTRATNRELRRVLEGSHVTKEQQPDLMVVISQPREASADWSDSDTVRNALLLPHAKAFVDLDGEEAARFGAVASGTVMLFARDGQRQFAGGVTFSRGHEGDNLGGQLLRDQLLARAPPVSDVLPAFGCRLCLPECSPQSGCTESPTPPNEPLTVTTQ